MSLRRRIINFLGLRRSMAALLSDEEIDAVASYVQGLR